MQNRDREAPGLPPEPLSQTHLSARLFYAIITSGLLMGMLLSCLGGWLYLEGNAKPTGRGIWEESASQFVVPICAIIGATFGGLAGVATAVGVTNYRRKMSKKKLTARGDL
jgi:hypothetical protein